MLRKNSTARGILSISEKGDKDIVKVNLNDLLTAHQGQFAKGWERQESKNTYTQHTGRSICYLDTMLVRYQTNKYMATTWTPTLSACGHQYWSSLNWLLVITRGVVLDVLPWNHKVRKEGNNFWSYLHVPVYIIDSKNCIGSALSLNVNYVFWHALLSSNLWFLFFHQWNNMLCFMTESKVYRYM